MAKRKLTPNLLEFIELYAEDQYTLEEIFDELNISKNLLKDEQVLQTYEKGLIQLFITKASSGMSDVDIVNSSEITRNQCILWKEQYKDIIEKSVEEKRVEEKNATRQFSNPLTSGMVNILEQNGKAMSSVSQDVLYEDIKMIVEKTQSGDTKALVTMLTTNIIQLQLFNKLSNMQLKVMQETRKSIMAINEITNPKRTTFIKEANQYNHLHQNSEKKEEKENELQKQLEKADESIDAVLFEEKEDFHEKK